MAAGCAILLGGIGGFTLREYAVGSYYYLGLSFGMLAAYLLMRSRFFARRNYDFAERFSAVMLLLGLLCVYMIAAGYYKRYLGISTSHYALGFFAQQRQYAVDVRHALPALSRQKTSLFRAVHARDLRGGGGVHVARGLLFGSLEFLVCCACWIYYGKNRALRVPLSAHAPFSSSRSVSGKSFSTSSATGFSPTTSSPTTPAIR